MLVAPVQLSFRKSDALPMTVKSSSDALKPLMESPESTCAMAGTPQRFHLRRARGTKGTRLGWTAHHHGENVQQSLQFKVRKKTCTRKKGDVIPDDGGAVK